MRPGASQDPPGRQDADGRTDPGPDAVRAALADLRAVAARITDPELRSALEQICRRLAGVEHPAATGRAPRLTPREIDVLALVAVGHSNLEVARSLALNPSTVKAYMRSAMYKLDSRNRVEAVNAARRAGLLP